MDLQTITTRVQSRLGRYDATTQGKISSWVNLALQRINNTHIFRQWKTSSIVTVNSPVSMEYSLPVGFRTMYALRYTDSKIYNYALKHIGVAQFERDYVEAEINPVYIRPEVYYSWGDKYYIYPIPLAGNLKLRWAKLTSQLTNPTDTPEIPYDELIIDMAVLVGAQELQYQETILNWFESNVNRRFGEAIAADNEGFKDYSPQMEGYSIQGTHVKGTVI